MFSNVRHYQHGHHPYLPNMQLPHSMSEHQSAEIFAAHYGTPAGHSQSGPMYHDGMTASQHYGPPTHFVTGTNGQPHQHYATLQQPQTPQPNAVRDSRYEFHPTNNAGTNNSAASLSYGAPSFEQNGKSAYLYAYNPAMSQHIPQQHQLPQHGQQPLHQSNEPLKRQESEFSAISAQYERPYQHQIQTSQPQQPQHPSTCQSSMRSTETYRFAMPSYHNTASSTRSFPQPQTVLNKQGLQISPSSQLPMSQMQANNSLSLPISNQHSTHSNQPFHQRPSYVQQQQHPQRHDMSSAPASPPLPNRLATPSYTYSMQPPHTIAANGNCNNSNSQWPQTSTAARREYYNQNLGNDHPSYMLYSNTNQHPPHLIRPALSNEHISHPNNESADVTEPDAARVGLDVATQQLSMF